MPWIHVVLFPCVSEEEDISNVISPTLIPDLTLRGLILNSKHVE